MAATLPFAAIGMNPRRAQASNADARRDPEIACAILENLLYVAGKTLRIASDGLAVIQTVQTGINGSDPNRAHMIAGNRGDGVFGNSEIPPVQLECAIVVKV